MRKHLVRIHQHLRSQPIWFVVLSIAVTSSLSLIGGMGLESVSENLLPLIPLVIAMPALNTMVSDYATIIAAHAGDPNERPRSRRQLARAISISILINIFGVFALSTIIAWYRDYDFTQEFLIKFGIFTTLAVVGAVSFMFLLTYFLDKIFERRKLNPDDLLIPIVTTFSDVLMLGAVAASALWLF